LLDCTSWQHKDQPLHLCRANQHGLPLEIVIENLFLKNFNPTTGHTGTKCTPPNGYSACRLFYMFINVNKMS